MQGLVNLRVRNIYSTTTHSADPCGTYAREVEDYTIVFDNDCPDVDGHTVSADIDACIGYSDIPLILTMKPAASEEFNAVHQIQSNVLIQSPHDIILYGR